MHSLIVVGVALSWPRHASVRCVKLIYLRLFDRQINYARRFPHLTCGRRSIGLVLGSIMLIGIQSPCVYLTRPRLIARYATFNTHRLAWSPSNATHATNAAQRTQRKNIFLDTVSILAFWPLRRLGPLRCCVLACVLFLPRLGRKR